MNYAIIYISGKQYIIKPNYWYDFNINNSLDYLKPNTSFFFKRILLLKKNGKIQIGQPFLLNVVIVGKILQKIKKKKIIIVKTKPKKKYTRKHGHRQMYSRIYIYN
jgi:large subunit ribosomal protein L21